jgi:hypothetical protein
MNVKNTPKSLMSRMDIIFHINLSQSLSLPALKWGGKIKGSVSCPVSVLTTSPRAF